MQPPIFWQLFPCALQKNFFFSRRYSPAGDLLSRRAGAPRVACQFRYDPEFYFFFALLGLFPSSSFSSSSFTSSSAFSSITFLFSFLPNLQPLPPLVYFTYTSAPAPSLSILRLVFSLSSIFSVFHLYLFQFLPFYHLLFQLLFPIFSFSSPPLLGCSNFFSVMYQSCNVNGSAAVSSVLKFHLLQDSCPENSPPRLKRGEEGGGGGKWMAVLVCLALRSLSLTLFLVLMLHCVCRATLFVRPTAFVSSIASL